MIGISTCWWEDSKLDGEGIINDAFDLGFEGIELEYRITDHLYHQMKHSLNKTIKVLSVHSFFPRPPELLGCKGYRRPFFAFVDQTGMSV